MEKEWEDEGAWVRIGRAAYLFSREAEHEEELRTARGGPRREGVRGGHWPPRALSAAAPQANWWVGEPNYPITAGYLRGEMVLLRAMLLDLLLCYRSPKAAARLH